MRNPDHDPAPRAALSALAAYHYKLKDLHAIERDNALRLLPTLKA